MGGFRVRTPAPLPPRALGRSLLRFKEPGWRPWTTAIALAVAVGIGYGVIALMFDSTTANTRTASDRGNPAVLPDASAELPPFRFDVPVRQGAPATMAAAPATVPPTVGAASQPQRAATPVSTDRPFPGGNPQAAGISATDNGLSLTNVRENSLFDRVGLQSGDVLMSVNGQAVGSQTDITALLLPIMRGEPAAAYVLRDGQTFPLKLHFHAAEDRLAAPQPMDWSQGPRASLRDEGSTGRRVV